MTRTCTGEVCVRSKRPSRKIKRVVHRPRRMIRGDVQRFEVVPVVFDLRAVGDGEAGVAEDLLDAPAHARDRMQPADRLAAARQRDVDGIARELRRELLRFERGATLIRALLTSASFASLIFAPAARRASGSIAPSDLQQRGDLAFLAEQANANLFEFLDVAAPRDLRARACDESLKVLNGFGHTSATRRSSGWIHASRESRRGLAKRALPLQRPPSFCQQPVADRQQP